MSWDENEDDEVLCFNEQELKLGRLIYACAQNGKTSEPKMSTCRIAWGFTHPTR